MSAPKRILAVDFGDRRTGLAATDYTGSIIVPLDTLRNLADDACARAIAELAAERESEVIVVGLPLDTRGERGPRAERTLAFAQLVEKQTSCPVVTVDETSTTDEAHDRLKQFGLRASQRKKVADSVAAMIILERYRG
ncbi:MAG: Holliday junction resolvase RuvX [Planctomycetes bacterium]|nr:Holliday junction resolvase RuvX [Planctomycetota bacterium]